MWNRCQIIVVGALWLCAAGPPALAQKVVEGERYRITRAAGPIAIDGDLSDAGWHDALRVDRWYEISPGDNTAPVVRSVGYLTYDDKFFYAGFEFDDPDPSAIVAPFADRDNIGSNMDFGGLFLDTRHDGQTAYEFQVTARNIQFDAVMDENAGENASPDFFWQSAARIHAHGWTLEIRVPFSSLRYKTLDPQTWGVILFRNYARGFRREMASVRMPRGSQCFVCRESPLDGLEHLPGGRHLIAAPYLSATQIARPSAGPGSPLANGPSDLKGGVDVKWSPSADHMIDGTIKPDFSQVEADTPQITANQRFALFFPEKRPFFLEGVELLSTPIQAVYTRTITAPRGGLRATGKLGGVDYTALVADDAGGGSVVLPGPNGSSFADQDFHSTVFIGRARKTIGLSFLSVLATDRESGDSGHNRVAGPDFQWRFHGTETVTGQWLVSDTLTPNRPDVAAEWTGASFTSSAGQFQWAHSTTHLDVGAVYKDYGTGFRADDGFVPQVGFRETYGEAGWTVHPQNFAKRVRTFLMLDRQTERDSGALILHMVSPGVGMDTLLNGFIRLRYQNDRIRAGDATFPRQQFVYTANFSPSRKLASIGIDGNVGEDVDFTNVRPGRGGVMNLNATLNPTDHLALDLIANEQWLDTVPSSDVPAGRVFTARVSRIRANYVFTARTFLRVIGQYTWTSRDPSLYVEPISARDGEFNGSVLFAYKINWQSVMFFGYGDDRLLNEQARLEPASRQLFVKVSYAFQH